MMSPATTSRRVKSALAGLALLCGFVFATRDWATRTQDGPARLRASAGASERRLLQDEMSNASSAQTPLIGAEITAVANIEVDNCGENLLQLEELFTKVYAKEAGVLEEYVHINISCTGNIISTSASSSTTSTSSTTVVSTSTSTTSSTSSRRVSSASSRTSITTATTITSASSPTSVTAVSTASSPTSYTTVSTTSTATGGGGVCSGSDWCGTEALCTQFGGFVWIADYSGTFAIGGISYQQDNNDLCLGSENDLLETECDSINGVFVLLSPDAYCLEKDPITSRRLTDVDSSLRMQVIVDVLIQIPIDASTNLTAYNASAVIDLIGNGTNASDPNDYLSEATQVIALNVANRLDALTAVALATRVAVEAAAENVTFVVVVDSVAPPVVKVVTTSTTSSSTSTSVSSSTSNTETSTSSSTSSTVSSATSSSSSLSTASSPTTTTQSSTSSSSSSSTSWTSVSTGTTVSTRSSVSSASTASSASSTSSTSSTTTSAVIEDPSGGSDTFAASAGFVILIVILALLALACAITGYAFYKRTQSQEGGDAAQVSNARLGGLAGQEGEAGWKETNF